MTFEESVNFTTIEDGEVWRTS